MIIRYAEEKNFIELRQFYDGMCKVLSEKDFLPEGDKGGFPPDEMIKDAIKERNQFMVAALYICGRYENAPDRIFTGKVSAPEGEWTIDASDGVTKAEVTFSLSDRGEHEEWVLLLRSHWKNYYVRVGDETIYHRNGKRDGSAVMSS